MALGSRVAGQINQSYASSGHGGAAPASASIRLPSTKVQESAWQKGLRQQQPQVQRPEPEAEGPNIGPPLQMADQPGPEMDPRQVEVPPPQLPQALEGLRAAIGQPGGEQFGAQSPPAPVQMGLGRRIYPQGGTALAQRIPKVY